MKTDKEVKNAAAKFAEEWSDPSRGGEKQDSQIFWTTLLTDVYGVQNISKYIRFEKTVMLDHTSFIDAYIPATRVLIEQKSRGKDLRKAIRQSDGTLLTPYQQAKRYLSELPLSEHPRWVVLSNFDQIHVYDMERPQGDPEIILLEDLQKDYYQLNFLIDDGQDEVIQRELEISVKAGEIVGKLYDALLREYRNPTDAETLKSLNQLIVRLVFCLYAEDSGVFPKHLQFHDYLNGQRDPRSALMQLFDVLDTPEDKRDPYLSEELLAFPYVNGGLFRNHGTEIPRLNDEIMEILLVEASEEFDWSAISPCVFGACMESTMNPGSRRSGGCHFTSVSNIRKVISPLFLDDLNAEFDEIKAIQNKSSRTRKLKAFQKKIASLTFFDPACGSGNFLTETYICLRKMENEILKILLGDQIMFGFSDDFNPIQVSIGQFYGIEINDFAVAVAKTALWIAEHQSMKATEEILHMDLDFLPLKSYTNIVEGNALRMDWNDVVSADNVNFITSNPPFFGSRLMEKSQKDDLKIVFGNKWKNLGNLDYASGWFKKAADYIQGTSIECALVATNSIVQGASVGNLWKPLLESGIKINFAHTSFVWDSEAQIKAHVHCVIVGFSTFDRKDKYLFTNDQKQKAEHINGYLMEGDDIFVVSRNKPICNVPEIGVGNMPIDDGNYLFSKEEMEEFIRKEPDSAQYFKPWYGAKEFINRSPRYCLWLGNCTPGELRKLPECRKRVESVKKFRLASKRKATRDLADTPTRFHRENIPDSNYLLIPRVSSERRRYVPIGFMDKELLSSDAVLIVPEASLYDFGILTSNVHNSWLRAVGGRLKSDYRYSGSVVYNNFPWPEPTDKQKKKIEQTTQGILDARALYPDSSLADLYDELTMPPELRKAHQKNDLAVMQAYGFKATGKDKMSESDCVAALMQMYQELIENENNQE